MYMWISTHCCLLSDKSLKYLKKGCKHLKVLRMKYCRNITKYAVYFVKPEFDKLT